MIRSFHVKNYKCLADVTIPLTPIHVIIGQNDAGKTSLLEALLALSRTTEKPLSQAFPGDWQGRELVYESSSDRKVEFHAEFELSAGTSSSITNYNLIVEFTSDVQRLCSRVEEWYGNGKPRRLSTNRSDSSSVGNRGRNALSEAERQALDLIASFLAPASLYRFDPKAMATPAAFEPARKFRMDSDGFGLATLLDDVLGYDAECFLKLRAEFCDFYPQFKSVRVETCRAVKRQYDASEISSTSTRETGKGIFFESSHGQTIRASQASDGAILFLGLLALIHTPDPPKLLLIEEPEKGVYPKRLDEVLRLIRRLQESPGDRTIPQVIITTHSPYLLTSFKPEEVTLLTREGETGPVIARPLRDAPNIEERLGNGEFYLGELWYNLSEDELFADAGATAHT